MTETDAPVEEPSRPIDRAPVRFLASGDEAGTGPEDRSFRPDVEGLRAVAVLLVVLYHVGIPHLGGYVGVDVFFVISGYVITGLLLRERTSTHKTSLLGFYGRRCRRIIPAAALVIVVTVVASRLLLGVITGEQVVSDARWASIFLANFHFTATGTNYFLAQGPPSPLQSFWSLAVEEQFYVVYPTIFLVVATLGRRLSLRAKLGVFLAVVVVTSLTWSIVQTSSDPTVAYFSPFTRAWELALGALVAVGAGQLRRLPGPLAAVVTWIGLAGIVGAAVGFTNTTPYPGSWVALPVVATALVIAGGTAAPRRGVEVLLSLSPFRWMGRWSYSLYLWHWPILIIAAQYEGRRTLPVIDNLFLAMIALGLSILTYFFVENPIRHARLLTRIRWTSLGLGATLTALSIGIITVIVPNATAVGAARSIPGSGLAPASQAAVQKAVSDARLITSVPADVTPSLASAPNDWGGRPADAKGCEAKLAATSVPACVFGDPRGHHTMVLYGDSHALMWFEALDAVAKHAHWRLVVLGKDWCHVSLVVRTNPPGFGVPGGRYTQCDAWHRFAIQRINKVNPDLLIVTEEPGGERYPTGKITPGLWEQGLVKALDAITSPKTQKVVLGNIPITTHINPNCLARHEHDVQACSGLPNFSHTAMNNAEKTAASASGARYIDVMPWFCSTTCTDIIDDIVVYKDSDHITATYSRYLENELSLALGFGPLP
ncbi:MAG TPA: acyltransferase family protein [Acidimicrobiales bacterium]|nr:acyltransferase family protein [Acidimicrobiales bacterium]